MTKKIRNKIVALWRLFKMGKNPVLVVWGLILFGIISIFILPWLFTRDIGLPSFINTGSVGDTINGVAGPFIAIIAAALTFGAFWVQYLANKEQRKQFAAQARDTEKQRFENIFYELLKIHRDNVTEMNIEDNVRGRKAFTSFFYEYRYIYFVFAKNYYELKDYFDKRENEKYELTNIAYIIFFFGVGFNSNKVIEELFEKYQHKKFFRESIEHLKRWRHNYKSLKERKKDLVIDFNGDRATFRIKYQPFNGHSGKLGHYFRHLFQTVKFVDKQDSKIIDRKYDYVKTLRAQLSNFEQLLLYYNCLSVLGTDWIEEGYIFHYEMVRNIPLPYANFGVKPRDFFKPDIDREYMSFEWSEVKTKIDNYNSTIEKLKKVSERKKKEM